MSLRPYDGGASPANGDLSAASHSSSSDNVCCLPVARAPSEKMPWSKACRTPSLANGTRNCRQATFPWPANAGRSCPGRAPTTARHRAADASCRHRWCSGGAPPHAQLPHTFHASVVQSRQACRLRTAKEIHRTRMTAPEAQTRSRSPQAHRTRGRGQSREWC
eukprot:3127044-Prymnesium_polylepis.1